MGRRDNIFLAAAVFFVIGLVKRNKSLWLGAFFFGLGLLATDLSLLFLKKFFHMPRPYEVLSEVYRVGIAEGFSFPSGHAATYSFVAVFMILVDRRWTFFWIILTLLGGLGRVYQGVHYPLDALAGWVLGGFLAYGAAKFYERTLRLKSFKLF